MGGPPKSCSLAEYTGHLVQGTLDTWFRVHWTLSAGYTGHLVQGTPLNRDSDNNSCDKELKYVRNTRK